LDQWQLSAEPFTTHIPQAAGLYNADGGYASVVGRVATLAQDAQRGMIVAGGMSSHGDMLAVMILSHHLGWPLVADPLSGVRLRASMNAHSGYLVPFMDQVLLAPSAAAELRPDVVIQVRVDSAT
jgi:isochorismate synthase/2-succinyl-5-enolpyruvyl-6-hydroxy-3-cyclohexene-1-carboxylate synthase/2-succinyl-6-hydroxy-2,4-cyclohexadiene-1-carboxylate synthase/O-succinylbenzoate synthase